MEFHPIVEFFPLYDAKRYSVFSDKNESYKSLKQALQGKSGLYAFYNSEGEIIYIGKSNDRLWGRMRNSFRETKSQYERYSVRHKKFTPRADRRLPKITRRPLPLSDVAVFFSAYSLPKKEDVDDAEKLIIRMVPNDLINVRMEGNNSLRSPAAGKSAIKSIKGKRS